MARLKIAQLVTSSARTSHHNHSMRRPPTATPSPTNLARQLGSSGNDDAHDYDINDDDDNEEGTVPYIEDSALRDRLSNYRRMINATHHLMHDDMFGNPQLLGDVDRLMRAAQEKLRVLTTPVEQRRDKMAGTQRSVLQGATNAVNIIGTENVTGGEMRNALGRPSKQALGKRPVRDGDALEEEPQQPPRKRAKTAKAATSTKADEQRPSKRALAKTTSHTNTARTQAAAPAQCSEAEANEEDVQRPQSPRRLGPKAPRKTALKNARPTTSQRTTRRNAPDPIQTIEQTEDRAGLDEIPEGLGIANTRQLGNRRGTPPSPPSALEWQFRAKNRTWWAQPGYNDTHWPDWAINVRLYSLYIKKPVPDWENAEQVARMRVAGGWTVESGGKENDEEQEDDEVAIEGGGMDDKDDDTEYEDEVEVAPPSRRARVGKKAAGGGRKGKRGRR